MRRPSSSGLLRRIEVKLAEASRILEELGYKCQPISSEEFLGYMAGDTPTGDTVTVYDVLDNEFFMVHEATEISELKKMNVPIDKQTVMRFYPKVYEAHFTAMDYELTCALKEGDYRWFKRRFGFRELLSLDDPYLPREFDYLRKELAPRVQSILEKFSRIAESLPPGS